MDASSVLRFSEDFETMTFYQGIAFVERTRRQIRQMIDHPNATDEDRQDLASVFIKLDALEKEIRADPNCPSGL